MTMCFVFEAIVSSELGLILGEVQSSTKIDGPVSSNLFPWHVPVMPSNGKAMHCIFIVCFSSGNSSPACKIPGGTRKRKYGGVWGNIGK